MHSVLIVIISMDIWITPHWPTYKSKALCIIIYYFTFIQKQLSLGIQSVIILIFWFSIKHLNIYITMRLILNIYITYNIKYPQYICTVSKKLVLAFKVSFYISFLHKYVNININMRFT